MINCLTLKDQYNYCNIQKGWKVAPPTLRNPFECYAANTFARGSWVKAEKWKRPDFWHDLKCLRVIFALFLTCQCYFKSIAFVYIEPLKMDTVQKHFIDLPWQPTVKGCIFPQCNCGIHRTMQDICSTVRFSFISVQFSIMHLWFTVVHYKAVTQ